jgi:hypothetical protein
MSSLNLSGIITSVLALLIPSRLALSGRPNDTSELPNRENNLFIIIYFVFSHLQGIEQNTTAFYVFQRERAEKEKATQKTSASHSGIMNI